jgi:hypothetical protein
MTGYFLLCDLLEVSEWPDFRGIGRFEEKMA